MRAFIFLVEFARACGCVCLAFVNRDRHEREHVFICVRTCVKDVATSCTADTCAETRTRMRVCTHVLIFTRMRE